MKTTKTLLAVSLLAALGAGSANASILSYTVTESGVTSGPLASGSLSGSGTATFDDSTNTLTITTTALNNQPLAGGTFTTNITLVQTGTVSGGLFTATAGTSTYNSCTDGSTPCPDPITSALGVPIPVSATPAGGLGGGEDGGGLFNEAFNIAAGGTNTTTSFSYGSFLQNDVTYVLTPTAPAVPVPAAAWLFGSGLVGMVGAARRRKAA